MSELKTCEICGFQTENGRVMSNHKRWQHIVKRDSDDYKIFLEKVSKSQIIPKQDYTCICERCNKQYILICTPSSYKKKEHFYCSRSCANARDMSLETKLKIQKALAIEKICSFCGTKYFGHKKYCSDACKIADRRKYLTEKEKYKKDCQFKFNLKDFPNEFDIHLLQEKGMYAAANAKHPNPEGVSRDHRVSIDYGWRHNIDPKIISHPANCRLITQNQNERKGRECEISLEQLLDEIKVWDQKYGEVAD